MTNYNDGKWHGWNGGECPVDVDTIVEGMYLRNDMPAPESPVTDRAGHFDWEYEAANTLIAFRVVKEHREQKEYTIDPRKNIIWYSSEDDLVHVKEV